MYCMPCIPGMKEAFEMGVCLRALERTEWKITWAGMNARPNQQNAYDTSTWYLVRIYRGTW